MKVGYKKKIVGAVTTTAAGAWFVYQNVKNGFSGKITGLDANLQNVDLRLTIVNTSIFAITANRMEVFIVGRNGLIGITREQNITVKKGINQVTLTLSTDEAIDAIMQNLIIGALTVTVKFRIFGLFVIRKKL